MWLNIYLLKIEENVILGNYSNAGDYVGIVKVSDNLKILILKEGSGKWDFIFDGTTLCVLWLKNTLIE